MLRATSHRCRVDHGSTWRRQLTFMVAVCGALAAGWQVRAEDLSTDRVFDSSRVIEVSIELLEKDWRDLCAQNRDIGKAFSGAQEDPFTYFKGKVTIDGVTIDSVGIRKKGFIGSLDNHWPSLKVKFDEYVEQKPIRGLDGLTLNNNKQDASLVSQTLTYQLFNAVGVHAPRTSFARVTVNGEYLGIYTNVEGIAKPFLKRNYGNSTGNLYEGTLADFYPKAIDRLEIKTNKKNHDRGKIARLAELLAADDALDINELEKLIDIDNFLRFWATESLIGFWDGYTNNQNNYWFYENPGDGKIYFTPWGADAAFMSQAGFGPGPRGPASVYAESMLANRLYHDAKTAERYRETMQMLLKEHWNEAELIKSVDRMEALLKDHLHKRQVGAPRAMNSVRNFIRTRREVVEKELANWPVEVAARPRRPMYHVEMGSVKGTFATKFADKAPANVADTGDAKVQLEVNGKAIALKQAGASVHRISRAGLPFFGGPFGRPQAVANLVISGIRESDEKAVTLTFPVDPEVLIANLGKSMEIQGAYSTGERSGGAFMPFNQSSATGNLTLSKAGAKADDPIVGEFELKLAEMRGGFADQFRRGPGGPPNGPNGFPRGRGFPPGGPDGPPPRPIPRENDAGQG